MKYTPANASKAKKSTNAKRREKVNLRCIMMHSFKPVKIENHYIIVLEFMQ